MDIVPWGVQQLMESSQITVRKESAWLKQIYSVTSQQRELLRIKSSGRTYKVNDAKNKNHQVAVLLYNQKWFKSSVMEVQFEGLPVITVKVKGGMSRSLLVMDETEQQVLKVRPHTGMWGKKDYQILGAGDVEVGKIRRSFRKSEFCFPSDLDVRYKVALIAAAIYEEKLED